MIYTLDTEFNDFGGELISLALVRSDSLYLYLATECADPKPWVAENVMPIVSIDSAQPRMIAPNEFGRLIGAFLAGDHSPVIITDWPDDIHYFCQALITAPGQMVKTADRVTFELWRVDAYPTELPGAVQHNALWDARALLYFVFQQRSAASTRAAGNVTLNGTVPLAVPLGCSGEPSGGGAENPLARNGRRPNTPVTAIAG